VEAADLLPTSMSRTVGRKATFMTTSSKLSYQVFINDPVPFSGTDRAPNGDRRMFQPLSSTLITGERDAVLADPPMTIDQTERVARWVEDSGKRLAHIYITHGHGDHWFGTAPLLRRFPGAVAYAAAGTIEVMRKHAQSEFRAAVWDKSFPGQIPDSPVLATTPPGNRFELEGVELRIVEVGHSDTDESTVLHVPSISLVVAGDVIYNGCHQYLAESQEGGLDRWMNAVDMVAALEPRNVVAGHKDKARTDDPKIIAETRRYLEDAKRLIATSQSALEFFNAMIEIYPERLNPSALWFWGAKVLFKA